MSDVPLQKFGKAYRQMLRYKKGICRSCPGKLDSKSVHCLVCRLRRRQYSRDRERIRRGIPLDAPVAKGRRRAEDAG